MTPTLAGLYEGGGGGGGQEAQPGFLTRFRPPPDGEVRGRASSNPGGSPATPAGLVTGFTGPNMTNGAWLNI